LGFVSAICLGFIFCTSAGADNYVKVESKKVLAGQSGVEIGIRFGNDVPLSNFGLPLEIRSVSNGAYISGTFTLTTANRIPGSPLEDMGGVQYYDTPEEVNSCSGPISHTWSGGSAVPNADGSPDAVMWFGMPLGLGRYFPVGDDEMTPSFILSFDVNANPGEFEIDTMCALQGIHLEFIDNNMQTIVPSFTKGVVTIVEGGYWPDCACPNPDGTTQDVITSPYGPRNKPPYDYHDGIDIDLEENDDIHAVLGGTVREQYYQAQYGWYVKTESEGLDQSGNPRRFYVLYHHMNEPVVALNEVVQKGQIIATCGSYPPMGTHVHVEIQPDLDRNKSAHPVRYLVKPEGRCPMFNYSEWQLIGQSGQYDYLECKSLSQKVEKYDLASIHVFVYTSTDSREAIIDFEDDEYMESESNGPIFRFFEGTAFDVTITLTPQTLYTWKDFHEIDIKVDPTIPFPSEDYIGIYLQDVSTTDCRNTGLCHTQPLARPTDLYCPAIGNVSGESPGMLLEFFEGRRLERGTVELRWLGTPGVNAVGVRIFRCVNNAPEEAIHNGVMPFRKATGDTVTFFDQGMKPSDELVYRIVVDFHNGASVLAEQIVVLAAEISEGEQIPFSFALDQNYPNPFNAGTNISFTIDTEDAGLVTLNVFNILGRRVVTLFSKENPETGRYSINWDGNDSNGHPTASGVYFYRLKTATKQVAKSMVLIR